MPRFTLGPSALFGGIALCLAACPAQAQYLYVGYNNASNFTTPGMATLSASGSKAHGNYAYVDATAATASYLGLTSYNTSLLTISGGTFGQLVADDSSVINLLGGGFTESSAFHDDPSGDPFYTITGTLQGDKSPFTAEFYAPSTGTLEFDGVPAVRGAGPVPEASTTVSLGLLLLLGAGAFAVKRRRPIQSSFTQ